jgi:UDP-N-acetyl-D-mannosaminuronic acid dehydrogenase
MNAPFKTAAALGIEAGLNPAPDHQVAVIGLGYIGLPTAALLDSYGWNVCGVDVSKRVVETVNAGGVHIEERDLDKLVHDAITARTLVASTEVPTASFYMIAVPTPLGEGNAPDISYVEAAARAIYARGIDALVVDISARPGPEGAALANAMGGRFLALPRADARTLQAAINAVQPLGKAA